MFIGSGCSALLGRRRARCAARHRAGRRRRRRCSTPTRCRSCSPPTASAWSSASLVPLLLGLADRRRAAAARRPLAGVPPPRRSPASGPGSAALVLRGRSLAANGGPGGGDRQMVDLFLAAHGCWSSACSPRPARVATTVLTTRAPGMTCAASRCSPGRRSIGALGCCSRCPVVDRRADLPVRRPTATAAGRLRRHRGPRSLDRLRLHPAGDFVYALPGVRRRRRGDRRSPSSRRLPMRGVVFAGIALVGVAALAGVTRRQQVVPRRHVRHRRSDDVHRDRAVR